MNNDNMKKTKIISLKSNKISILAQNTASKATDAKQGQLDLEIEKDVGGIGMGVLSDGTPYLN
jgi:hypothetical protein